MKGLPAEASLWRDRMLDEPERPQKQVEKDPKRILAFFGQAAHDVEGG